MSDYPILKSNGCHSSIFSVSLIINYIEQYLWFSGLLQKRSQTRPFKTVMKIIITQLPASCATETYVTKSASQEMPDQGSKYKIPPTSSIGQPRLCHYSVLCFLSYSSFIPYNTLFPALCISFRQLLHLHGSSLSRQYVQSIREPLSFFWVTMLRMRAGCRSQRQKRRKASSALKWGFYTHSHLLRICETCMCSGPVAPQENSHAKLLLFTIMIIHIFFHRKKINMPPTSISTVNHW